MNEKACIDRIFMGDFAEYLKIIPSESMSLIVTSPRYGYNRKSTYGGVRAQQYVEWFSPIERKLENGVKVKYKLLYYILIIRSKI